MHAPFFFGRWFIPIEVRHGMFRSLESRCPCFLGGGGNLMGLKIRDLSLGPQCDPLANGRQDGNEEAATENQSVFDHRTFYRIRSIETMRDVEKDKHSAAL
jgi:hypothetical protein